MSPWRRVLLWAGKTPRRCLILAESSPSPRPSLLRRAAGPMSISAPGHHMNIQRRCITAPPPTEGGTTADNQPASPEAAGQEEEPLFEDPRLQILQAALDKVPTEGWTDAALVAGATSLGFPSLSHGMFVRGPIELVEYFLDKCNKEGGVTPGDDVRMKWMDELDRRKEEFSSLTPRERIHIAIELRLRQIAPMVPQWPEALALGVLPHNLESTAKHIAILADELCHRAGKDAVDLVWYKDRAMVAGVYVSTELFFLTDYSEDFGDTWSFLERRLDDMENLEKTPHSLGDGAHAISTATTAIVSAISSLVQPAVLQAVQKMPVTGAVSVVLQTVVANLVAMAPPVPSPDGLTPTGEKVAQPGSSKEGPFPPPSEKDPYATTTDTVGKGTAVDLGQEELPKTREIKL